jgi:hypothetical protein
MKYLPYVLKHLKRNWIRTASTLAGLALCIFLICVLQTVLDAIRKTSADADPSHHLIPIDGACRGILPRSGARSPRAGRRRTRHAD